MLRTGLVRPSAEHVSQGVARCLIKPENELRVNYFLSLPPSPSLSVPYGRPHLDHQLVTTQRAPPTQPLPGQPLFRIPSASAPTSLCLCTITASTPTATRRFPTAPTCPAARPVGITSLCSVHSRGGGRRRWRNSRSISLSARLLGGSGGSGGWQKFSTSQCPGMYYKKTLYS